MSHAGRESVYTLTRALAILRWYKERGLFRLVFWKFSVFMHVKKRCQLTIATQNLSFKRTKELIEKVTSFLKEES